MAVNIENKKYLISGDIAILFIKINFKLYLIFLHFALQLVSIHISSFHWQFCYLLWPWYARLYAWASSEVLWCNCHWGWSCVSCTCRSVFIWYTFFGNGKLLSVGFVILLKGKLIISSTNMKMELSNKNLFSF